jgi:alcohol dehydrogenase, propanol-preferring
MPTWPAQYRAMALMDAGQRRLQPVQRTTPAPGAHELLLRVGTCGVCRTDLHLLDGDIPPAGLPRVPGHEIVGRVQARGDGCTRFTVGQRVGVPWLARTCGTCSACRSGRENLCPEARFTGLHTDGGYAEFALAHEDYCFALPDRYDDDAAAPLLCAGLIGWRALRLAGSGRRLGIYGFGAAGHLIAQVALAQGREVFVFTRSGDDAAQALARELGVHGAAASGDRLTRPLDASLLFAPAGELVPLALSQVAPGGRVVCAGIHMSEIPCFPYALLWGERCVCSVANLTRADGETFFAWAASHPLKLTTTPFPLAQANQALSRLRDGRITGAAVLRCGAEAPSAAAGAAF